MPSHFYKIEFTLKPIGGERVVYGKPYRKSRNHHTHESMKYFRNLRHTRRTHDTHLAYVPGYYYTMYCAVVSLLR